MNADSFMHLLAVLLVAGLGGYYGLRYLRGRLDVGPARVYHPLNVVPYFRGAWEIFPRFRTIGWLLTGALFVNAVLSFKFGDTPPYSQLPDGLIENTSVSQFFIELLSNLHRTVFYSQNVLTKPIYISGGLPFIILLAYVVYEWVGHLDGEHRNKAARISGYIIIGTVIQGLELMLSAALIDGGQPQPVRVSGFVQLVTGIFGTASYFFLLLCATVAEALFLRIVYKALKGTNVTAANVFGSTVDCFRPLFLFNIVYFGLPFVLSSIVTLFWSIGSLLLSEYSLQTNHANYISSVVWFFRMLFFLVPFLIVKDGLDLKSALKKNISIVTRAPLDYLALMLTVIISMLIVAFAYGAIIEFLILPHSHSYVLMQIAEFVIDIYYIWFSLFAACVFAIFSKQRFLNQPE